jgi:hypothetical protein
MTESMNPPKVVRKVAKIIAAAEHDDGRAAFDANPERYLAAAESVTDLIRAEIAAELNTLAEFRNEYGGPGPHEDAIAREVHTARLLAKIIGREHDALGWLPSWKTPAYAKKHNPNGSEVFVR